MSESPRGLPAGAITNGEDTEQAYLSEDGEALFAEAGSDFHAGPAAIDPQDADRLLAQMSPSIAVNHGAIHESEFDEYLRGKDGMSVYHQMATDGTVKNGLSYLYGSMRSADWRVHPASDAEEDIEIAAFVADQLGVGGHSASKYTFGRLLQIHNRSLVYGKSFGEIVLAPGASDHVILDKIVPIHPFTVDEIKYDKRGGPDELVLSGTVKGGRETVSDKRIPIWKTISFIHDDDGTFQGRSFLRAAVAHWRVKRSLIVMINQGMERYLIGVPQIRVPKSVRVGSDEWKQAKAILRNFVTRPRTGILLQPDWEFEVVKLHVAMPDAKPYLEYHDAAIARSMGFDWNTIQSNDGIQNMNVNALEGITRNTVRTLLIDFTEAVNTYLIPKLVLPNWPGVRNYPRLVAHLDAKEDFSASANLMGMMINAAKDSLSASKAAAKPAPAPAPAPAGAEEPDEAEEKDDFAEPGDAPPAAADAPPPAADSGGSAWSPEELADTVQALMGILPPRFKKALGYDEEELETRMAPYRNAAQRRYRNDKRKPDGPTGNYRYRDLTGTRRKRRGAVTVNQADRFEHPKY